MRKWFLLIITVLLAVIPATAQDDDTSNSAFVRAAHFSADAPAVDVYVNGELTLEAVEFPAVSDYLEVEAGTYSVDIVPTGGAIEDAVLSGEYDLSAGDWATLAAIGELERETLAIQPIIEDLSNIPDGLAYVGVFHAIADLDPVTVFVGETELASLLSYPDSLQDTDGYAGDRVLAEELTIDVQDADGNSLLSTDPSVLGAGRAYFAAAVGTATNPVLVFIPTDVSSMTAEMVDPLADVEVGDGTGLARLAHFSVDAPPVDIYVDGELLLETIQFGDITDYSEFDAGIYDVALVPTGEPLENAVYSGQIAIVADSLTLVSAVGFFENETLKVVTATEVSEAPRDQLARIAFFQTVPSLELFDLLINGETLLQGVAYPAMFEGAGDGYVSTDIVAGAYEFEITSTSQTINVGDVTTGSGRVYLIVATGNENAPFFFLIADNFPEMTEE